MQERLDELAFARALAAPERWDPGLREHATGCAACAAHLRFLRSLGAELDALASPAPAPEMLAAARVRASRALRARTRPASLWRPVVQAAGLSLAALPIVVLHAFVVAEGAVTLLGPVVPSGVLTWLGVSYFGSVALGLGGLAALLPLVASATREARADAGAEAA
jgi:hypothetical protein